MTNQFTYFDNAPPSLLLTDSGFNFLGSARADAQRGIERGQGTRTPESAGHLDGCPRRRRSQSTLHASQRRAYSLVHHQAVNRAHSNTRIQDVSA